jgi:hypothetical protein
MVEEELKLLAYQQTLDKESTDPRKRFVGLSINETIRLCITSGSPKKADKIRADWKVPDKRCAPSPSSPVTRSLGACSFWLVKMKALVEVRDWEGLELFAKSKKSPVGYEVRTAAHYQVRVGRPEVAQPFVDHLVATGNHRQALNFVPRCEQRHRVELYIKCGEWLKAAQECRDRGDRGRLLCARCPYLDFEAPTVLAQGDPPARTEQHCRRAGRRDARRDGREQWVLSAGCGGTCGKEVQGVLRD